MMFNRKSKSYKYGMRTLYAIMGVSFVFFASIVTLRVNHDAQRYIIKHYSNQIFHIDVFKHKAYASFQDLEEQHITAHKLVKNSLFSPIYFYAGKDMMKSLADHGHAPSQLSYGDLLKYSPNAYERNVTAIEYYIRAAKQNNKEAQNRLAEIK